MDTEPVIIQLGITKTELVKVLENCARKDICEHFKISERTLSRIIYDYQLQKTGYGPKQLTKETCHDIRVMYGTGKYTQADIADKFHISQSLVSRIVNKQIHKTERDVEFGGQAAVKVGYNGN